MENPNIARRIDLIERIYEVNEENYQKLGYELVNYIKNECNGNAVYWYKAIVHANLIRPLRVKYAMLLLQIVHKAFQLDLLLSIELIFFHFLMLKDLVLTKITFQHLMKLVNFIRKIQFNMFLNMMILKNT